MIWEPQEGPQELLLRCPVGDVFFGGARGGGKSDALLGDCAAHCHRHGQHANAYLIRRTYPELEELIDRAIEIYVPLGAEWLKGEKTFRFPSWGGSKIRFRYLDRDVDAMQYQGKNINYLGIDELGNFPTPSAPDRLFGALRSAHGVPALFRATGNPGGPGHEWVQERYVDPAKPMKVHAEKLPNGKLHKRVFIPSFITDNKLLLDNDPEYINRLYLVGAPWLVKAWLEGDWNARPEGHFFDTTALQYGVPPRIDRIYIGVDPATRDKDAKDRDWDDRDYTAIVVIGVDYLGRYWLLTVIREQMDTAKWTQHLFRLHAQWKATRIFIEGGPIWRATEPWLRQQMQIRGMFLPITTCNPVNDKAVRATPMQTVINAGGLWVPSDGTPWLHNFLTELSIFDPNKARKGEIHDDQVDAAAWIFLKLLDLQRSNKAEDLVVQGLGPVGKHMVQNGMLDGHAAEEILRNIDLQKTQRDSLFDPSTW